MAAACLFLLGTKRFEVGTRFIFVTITAGNYSGTVVALCPNQDDNTIMKPAQTLQAFLSISFAFVFYRDHWSVKHAADLG